MSRDLKDLNLYVQKLAKMFLDKCKANGLNVVITQTLRTIREQNDLYDQGRTKPGKIVTNARGGDSFHNYGLAFDIAVIKNGVVDWNDTSLYEKAGQIGKSIGLEWGGDFRSFKDKPHFQWSDGLSIKDLKAGKKPKIPANLTEYSKIKSVTKDKIPVIKKGIVAVELLNCRKTASDKSDINGRLKKGTQVIIYEECNGWYLVNKVNPQWVNAKYIKLI